MKKRLSLILALSMILTPLSQAREQSGLLNVRMGGISDQGQIHDQLNSASAALVNSGVQFLDQEAIPTDYIQFQEMLRGLASGQQIKIRIPQKKQRSFQSFLFQLLPSDEKNFTVNLLVKQMSPGFDQPLNRTIVTADLRLSFEENKKRMKASIHRLSRHQVNAASVSKLSLFSSLAWISSFLIPQAHASDNGCGFVEFFTFPALTFSVLGLVATFSPRGAKDAIPLAVIGLVIFALGFLLDEFACDN